MKLTNKQRKQVAGKISSLFDAFKVRLLGRFFKGPTIIFEAYRESVDPMNTIEGVYRHALHNLFGTKAEVDETEVENLSDIASNYIDAKKLHITNHIIMDITNAKNPQQAKKSLRDNLVKINNYVELLTGSETKITQAYANRAGIAQVASSVGDSDPTVVFRGVTDSKLCKVCKAMYHDEENIRKPKPYKLSEIAGGYLKLKEWDWKTPYFSGHVNCRHILSYVAPGFTMDNNGYPKFHSFEYDYYKDYWGKTEKSESNFTIDATSLAALEEFMSHTHE